VEQRTAIEEDIRSTPAVLRQTCARVDARRATLAPLFDGPLVFLGCGSSYCVALAAAAIYEQKRRTPAQASIASDYTSREGWTHVAISRTGQTTEVVDALRRVRAAGGRSILVAGEAGSAAEPYADETLVLEFASEQGVIQTRFITASIEALRLLTQVPGAGQAHAPATPDGTDGGLASEVEEGLGAFDPSPYLQFDHVVFLGRDWRYGLARSAALNLQETALLVPESHQTLNYRHGPIATADEHTLIWCFDPADDVASAAVLDDVRRTGATVRATAHDPLVSLVQAQLFALRKAESRGMDPSAPRNLSRAVILTR
jgi:glucosamine--fructose-6-phosphate aminotransferase (isomerizing)